LKNKPDSPLKWGDVCDQSGCGEFRPPRTHPDEVWLIKPDGTGELLKVVDYYGKLLKPP